MKKFDYVAEINLPSNSAYPLHVLKMCDDWGVPEENVDFDDFGE